MGNNRLSARRIAFFLASLRFGGAERMSLNLAEAIVNRGVPVDLVVADAEGELLPEVPPQVRLLDLKCRRVRGALPQLVRYLRREQPAGMISRVDHANVVAALAVAIARSPTRLAVTAASRCLAFPDATVLSPLRARMRERTWLPLMRWAYRRADAVVAVSRGIADELCDRLRLNANQIHVINNPVVTPRIAELAQAPPPHPWLEDGRLPTILFVGRLVWQKDPSTLLRSLAILRKTLPARMVLLGEGPLRAELEQLRRALGLDGVCDMPGHCANPYAAMARADLLALSSQSEGSPNVLAEALACGCPVVATDCPSGPREILAGGKYCLLTPVGDAEALAVAMRQALARSWNRDALRERAAAYASDTSAGQYLTALRYPHEWGGGSEAGGMRPLREGVGDAA